MRSAFTSLVLAVLSFWPCSILAQPAGREFRGELFSIEEGEQTPKFLPNVLVTVREFGATGLTSDRGLFRIKLPTGVLPGQEITLRHDKNGYTICSPLFGRQIVP